VAVLEAMLGDVSSMDKISPDGTVWGPESHSTEVVEGGINARTRIYGGSAGEDLYTTARDSILQAIPIASSEVKKIARQWHRATNFNY